VKGLLRNRTRIQGRLAWVFGAFLLLVIVSALLTYWGLEVEPQDARVINLAGASACLSSRWRACLSRSPRRGDEQDRGDLTDAGGMVGARRSLRAETLDRLEVPASLCR
jgi:hypothetical protein